MKLVVSLCKLLSFYCTYCNSTGKTYQNAFKDDLILYKKFQFNCFLFY